ncbi:MAG: GIY-YIG nuclease family protein [Planctomycetota bacterium]|mgnify:CR=1 FL=1
MNTTTPSRSLELFFIDGRPDGMLTAEVFNWTGHVLMTPRTQLSEALRRAEAQYTGIYLLFGEKEGASVAYIGEAEDVSDRIRSHDAQKDWWTQAILITSAANNLNKAHVKYLESRLVEEARAVGKIVLENGNTPPRPGLSEAARANMEAFLEYVLMILPALRIDCFLRNTRPALDHQSRTSPVIQYPHFELISERSGVSATAHLIDGEFVVQAGSSARASWVGQGSEGHTYAQLYAELVRTAVLVDQNNQKVFSTSYAFKSPSAAAAVIQGRPTNGTIDWKISGTNKTYKQWEAETLQH